MKKIIITLALLIFSFAGFSQKVFTQATLDELVNEYKKDSKAFFINRLSDDGRYSNQQGIYLGKAAIVNGDKQNIVSTELLQPVIFQSGDLAISSGIHQTVRIDKDGSQKTGQVAATYTWQRRNNKWMFIASQQTPIAPSTFDEATFNGIMARLQTDPAFFNNETDPNFILTFGSGSVASREGILKFAENNIGLYKRKETNLKVSQSGSTGIATGTVEESFLSKDNPSVVSRTYKGLFTYTFSQVNGKWLWVSAQHTDYKAPKADDEMAIRQTCENETKYFHEADTKNWDSQWSQKGYVEYQSQFLNEMIKMPFAKGTTLVGLRNSVNKTLKPDGLISKVTDFEARINGNMAWATYTQEDFKGETSTAKSRQLRILEKIDGSWKIVGLSIQKM